MADTSDDVLTIKALKADVADFISERQWEPYHDPKAVAMSIAIEAAELVEPFQWLDASESWDLVKDQQHRDHIAEELADVLIYCLSFANLSGIDMSAAVRSKLAKNRARFPVQSGGNPPG